jgi:RimJ/RimL family protein N-acetyltransferase
MTYAEGSHPDAAILSQIRDLTAVTAHTLAEHNASNRVLEKVGFQHDGHARENGEMVWRFSLNRPA